MLLDHSKQAASGEEVHNVRGARTYYTDVGKRPIGGGLELWQGLFQSVRSLHLYGGVLNTLL